jgi:class 3 adenylate cyclase/predicted ATPase
MTDVRRWLEQHGCGEFVQAFEENQIDLDIARDLTDQDLRDMGVAALGQRKRLLRAVAQLKVPESALTESPPKQDIAAPKSAERRQLTILFCDLVGSSALSQRLDPERLREVMQAYQETCRTIIEKYEGHVAQYLGDGLMVYFGWPRAHEHDAERSVRSALEIISAIGRVEMPDGLSPLQVRIGVATGPVVVGETGAGDASVPKLAVGETPNLAARLQGLAGPNEIIIGPGTHRLVGATFTYIDLGPQTLKGIVEPVRSFRVTGLGSTTGRFEAAHGLYDLTALVGRENELALMEERWEQAKAGEGQVVLLGGEPGIGKSRIVQALRHRIEAQDHSLLRYQCSPYHTQSALYPIVEQLENTARFSREDAADEKLNKLETLLRPGGRDLQSVMPLFAGLLSLPADRYPALNYPPQKRKERLLEALVEQVGGLSRSNPVLIIFEDAHWVDPTTQEALDLLGAHAAKWRVLLVMTYRPEYAPRWSGEAHVTTLTLNRFNRRLGAQLAENVTGGKALPPEIIDQILAKTDGVPLFVEELTKTVLESGLLKDRGDRYELEGPLPPLAIPSTLHDSLMARLDRLAQVKEVAQIGACIGREFGYELLAAVSPVKEHKLTEALEQLVHSQLVYQHGTQEEATYTFKHALVQDAAYESLLKSRRQQMHQQIAQALERRFHERVVNEPEVLAHHYTEAGALERATDYWLQAGQRGAERFANAEAIAHLTRGLKTLQALPEGREKDQRELLLQINLGGALGSSKGYSPPEVGQAFARAKDLCERVGDMPQMFPTLSGLWLYYTMRAEYPTAEHLGTQILELSRHATTDHHLIAAHNMVGIGALFTGKFEKASQHFEAGLRAYEAAGSPRLGRFYGFDPGLTCLEWLAWISMITGFGGRSRRQYEAAMRSAHQYAEPLSLGTAMVHLAGYNMLCEDPASALTNAQQAVAFCKENRIFLRQVEAEMIEGWALAELGSPLDGLRIMQPAINAWSQLGAKIWNSMWYSALARVHIHAGQTELAHQAMRHAFNAAETAGEEMSLADLHRLDGDLELFVRHPNRESCYREAIRLAHQQKAKLFEVRAATALARLRQSQRKNADARALLKPVYDWFTEGFDTKELKDAKAVLDQVLH